MVRAIERESIANASISELGRGKTRAPGEEEEEEEDEDDEEEEVGVEDDEVDCGGCGHS